MKYTNLFEIVIPIRIDSLERERNINFTIHFLQSANIRIRILEADKIQKFKISDKKLNYRFIKDNDPIFYRTHYLNLLIKECTAPVVGVWDTDVILTYNQIEQSVHSILYNHYKISSPYNGNFIFLNKEKSKQFLLESSIDLLKQIKLETFKPSWGGAFFINKETYLKCGGENEHFYGWGPEDSERIHRMEILGYPIYRVDSPMYHLWHPIGANSTFISPQKADDGRKELIKVCSMTQNELLDYIATWKTRKS